MNSIPKNPALGNIDQYVSLVHSLAEKVERDGRNANSPSVRTDPSKSAAAQLELEQSTLELTTAINTAKKILDMMREILRTFAPR